MSKSRPSTAALASPRELQPRSGMPLHAPAELAVDDLADRFEQLRAPLRRQRRMIRERRERIQVALAVEEVRLREEPLLEVAELGRVAHSLPDLVDLAAHTIDGLARDLGRVGAVRRLDRLVHAVVLGGAARRAPD